VRVVQIVPHLPPPFEGVGTYAAALAQALEKRFGIETRFVVGDPSWSGGENGAQSVQGRTAADLAATLAGSIDAVLLHYANYGYQRRGCPVWLAAGLSRGRWRLVTLFHEVWASGPPWRSSFWLLPAQRRLAAVVAHRSAALVTTLDLYGDMIRPWARGKEIEVLPVFSTVGEPGEAPVWEERARRLVVFGGAGVRGRAYGRFLPALTAAVKALAAAEVWDVGPPIACPAEVGGVPIRGRGILPAAEVSEILRSSAAGFLAYPPAFLPKSTIFAAYCSHGALPVCAWDRHPRDGALAAGRHYWAGSGDPRSISAAAREWYLGHTLTRQTERFRDLLAGAGERA
jgi:hypothetical protein